MAHEIEKFGYVGDKAWHGLGMKLEEGLDASQAFEKLGMGWTTGLFEVPPLKLPDGRLVGCPDNRIHVRMDTAETMGIVGKDYQPISNQEMAKFADILAGEDKAIRVETGGSLRGGRRVFVLIKLPRDTHVTDDDVLRNYVCISNGHDGINSFNVFHTPIRVVCANTLRMAENAMKGARFAHTGDISQKVELARAALGIVVARSEHFVEQARAMAKVSLTDEKRDAYFEIVYGKTFGEETTEKHQTETVTQWIDNMSITNNMVKSTEGSLWQGFNAITYFHDHQRGRFKTVAESEGRVHSNLFGASNSAKGIAFKEALALVP